MREVTSGVGKGGLSELGKGALFVKTWAWEKSLPFLWTLFLPRPPPACPGKKQSPFTQRRIQGEFLKSCKFSMGGGGADNNIRFTTLMFRSHIEMLRA